MTCRLVPDLCKPVHELAGYFHITTQDAELFVARAFKQYIRDIRQELATGKNPEPYAEYPSALTDWNGGRYQLKRLAKHCGLEPDELAEEIEQSLAAFWNKHGAWTGREGKRAA